MNTSLMAQPAHAMMKPFRAAMAAGAPTGNPFALDDEQTYLQWRRRKLARFPATVDQLMVTVDRGWELSALEFERMMDGCRRANMVMYSLVQGDFADKRLVANLGAQFGLHRLDKNLRADEDAITSLQMVENAALRAYIPYSNRALRWHTDGYYNPLDQQVRGVVMHCVSKAAVGGDNLLLDHEMVYLQLRDKNPEFVAALMAPEVMTIPANVENGVQLRGAQTGPVFSVGPQSGSLHMRFTARNRHISWQQDATTQAAVECLNKLMSEDADYVFHVRLDPGQGIICNNVLHGRSAYQDDAKAGVQRLLYRARYYDRITGTGIREPDSVYSEHAMA